MSEPYATTLNLESIWGQEPDDIIKSSRIILAFCIVKTSHLVKPTFYNRRWQGSLFAMIVKGNSCIIQIKQKAKATQSQYKSVATLWFRHYLHCLIPGVFNYYFKLPGVAF
ncbi:hypothetical protein OK016_24875 [Vibrio chagasii]|nr:hypothetical protein [Vibrio chagasii]